MKIFKLLSLTFLLFSTATYAQPETIESLLKQSSDSLDIKPKSSLTTAIMAFQLSEKLAEDYWLGMSAESVSRAYHYLSMPDSSAYYTEISLKHNLLADNGSGIGKNYVQKGSYELDKGRLNKALDFYQKAIPYLEENSLKYSLADVYLRMTMAHFEKDELQEAMTWAKKCYDYSLSIDYTEYVAYAVGEMSLIQKKMGNFEKAIEMQKEAIEFLRQEGESFGEMAYLNNLGISLKELGQFEEALDAYNRAITICKKIDYPKGTSGLKTNKGILYNILGNYKEANKELSEAIDIAESIKFDLGVAESQLHLSRSLVHLGKTTAARNYLENALTFFETNGSLENQAEGHKIGSELYEKTGAFYKALEEQRVFQVFNDSIFQLEKIKQIQELQTKYETEKKDAEILVLEKNAEIDKIRKISLISGLVLLALTGSVIVFSLIQKRKKDKMIFAQEKVIEKEKLLNAQQSLEAKQKELSSKLVQLAHKNEFLGTLDKEIENLKTDVGSKVDKVSTRISRMIRRDIVNDKQWEQFSEEFSGVHQGFLDALVKQFGGFSRSEIRLISLLKMNLNSKEISDVLGISDEGVRKARYRLRKKLNLSDTELQGYLLSFSGKA